MLTGVQGCCGHSNGSTRVSPCERFSRTHELGEFRDARFVLCALIFHLAGGVDIVKIGNRDGERLGREAKRRQQRQNRGQARG
jgi:hypothetical protein